MTNPPEPTDTTAGTLVRLQAVIGTDRAQRYLDQLARHAAAITAPSDPRRGNFGHPAPHVHVEHTGSSCTLSFPGQGACTLAATADQLTARVDAADAASAQRIADLITADLRRFSQRHPLNIDWQQG